MRGDTTVEFPLIRPDCVGPPSPASGRRDARLAIGLGFRKAATVDTLAALVRDALSRLPPDFANATATLATIAEKDRPPLRDAAARLGLPVSILPKAALAGTEDRITVASEPALACLGIPSVAEAAALVAAGPGARLVVTRIAVADATCAIAAGHPDVGLRPVQPPPPPSGRSPSPCGGGDTARSTASPPPQEEGDHAKRGGGGGPGATDPSEDPSP